MKSKHHAVLRLRLPGIDLKEAARILGLTPEQFHRHHLTDDQAKMIHKTYYQRKNEAKPR